MPVVLIIFVCLTIAGSWAGWRRSPLYSAKITLQLVGAFLLILAVIGGVLAAILNGPISRSPVALGVALVIAIPLLTTGAMVLIIRITDSHVAQLPSSVKLVALHRHKVQRWIWRLLVFLLVCAGAGLILPDSWNWLPLGAGGFMLLLCGPMLAIFYMMARRNDRGMTAVMATPWVHWEYTPQEWEAWARTQLAWEQSKAVSLKTQWRRLTVFLLVCTALFAVGALLAGGGFMQGVLMTAGLSAFLVILLVIAYTVGRGAPGRHYRRLLAAPPEAYFGEEGVFCNGEYLSWLLSGKYLLEAAAGADPAHLILSFLSFNGSSSVTLVKRVPIPEGRAADLPLLRQKLAARCPKAFVHFAA